MSDKISEEIEDSLIKKIIDSITITDEGKVSYKGPNRILTISREIDILSSILQEKTDFFKEIKTKRYFVPPKTIIGLGEFIEIFKKLKKDNKSSFDDFKSELNNRINEIAKMPKEEFTLVYPLNFKFPKKVDSEINEDKFEILSFEDFSSRFFDVRQKIQEAEANRDIQAKFQFLSLKEVCNDKFSFFIIKVYARNMYFSIEYATERLLCVLGLMTFAKYRGQEGITIVGRASKQSNLSLSKVLIFKAEDFKYFDFNEQITSFEEISEANIDNFFRLLQSYNEIKRLYILKILERALISYYEASIDDDIAYSFLKYWICIELCLLKSEGITENEIIKRLKSMLIEEDEYLKIRIDWLYRKRNNLVHQLNMDISQFDRNLIKLISESLIDFLLIYGNRFPNNVELNLFYKFLQENNESLSIDKKVIDSIIAFRKSLEITINP